MATAKISVCTDEETKKEVEGILADMGLNMTTAINIYLKRIQMDKAIPFELTTKTYNQETINAMNEYDTMVKNPEKYKKYTSFKELLDEVL